MRNKRILVVLFGVLSFILVGCGAIVSVVDEPATLENLVPNFSFEDVSTETGFAQMWSTRRDEGVMEFKLDSTVVRNGVYSVRTTGVLKDTPNRGPIFQRVVAPEGTYRFSAWYQTDGVTKDEAVQVRIRFFDVINKQVVEIEGLSEDPQFEVLSTEVEHSFAGDKHLHVHAKPSQGTWNRMDIDFVTPVNTKRILIELFLWKDTGTIYWDDIYLIQQP